MGPRGGRDVAGESLGFDVMCLRCRSAAHRLANEVIVFSGHKLFAQKNPSKWGLPGVSRKPSFWQKMLFIEGRFGNMELLLVLRLVLYLSAFILIG